MEQPVSFDAVIELLTRHFAELETKALQESGLGELSMKQIVYLDTVAALDRPTFTDLANRLGVSKPSVTAIIGRLIQKGYVEKIPSNEDRRVSHIVLTEKGRSLSSAHQNFHRKIARHFAGALDAAEMHQLGQLLYKALKSGLV
jgi:DNA-binding MarR family transcriptional regulator